MRLDSYNHAYIEVTLSKRNCLTLASKANRDNSERTLIKKEPGEPDLIVYVEPDDVHYETRGYGPGRVHDKDEPELSDIELEQPMDTAESVNADVEQGYMLKMACPACATYGSMTTKSQWCSRCKYVPTAAELQPALDHDRADRAL